MTQPIDTPDYQRGVVNAQALLASVPANTRTVTVGIPPNAESLIVMLKGYGATQQLYCEGVTTGLQYPGSEVLTTGQTDPTQTFIFDVTNVIDEQVALVCNNTPTVPWWVYSDAGVHVTVDMSKLSNYLGQQYVIPSVPGVQAGDHPPNEISHIGAYIAASGVIASGAGAGQRYRVYAATMSTVTAGIVAQITDFTTGATLLTLAGPGNSQLPYIPQGIPLTNNASLGYQLLTGAGSVLLNAYYTIETI